MLQLLTTYLFQHRKVGIPHVGTIYLVQHPPVLELVDKQLLPPKYSVQLKDEHDDIPEHQLDFLTAFSDGKRDMVVHELEVLGNRLHQQITGSGYEWNGLGFIHSIKQDLPVTVKGFENVAAGKVIRPDSQHNVLVGDKEHTSVQITEQRVEQAMDMNRKSRRTTIAWVVLALSILAIALILYLGKFRVNTSGAKQSPLGFSLRFVNHSQAYPFQV